MLDGKQKHALHKSKAHKHQLALGLVCAFESICVWRHECVSEYLAIVKYVFVSGVPAGQRCVPALC